ncbi:response regulator [Halomonas koreensis]|uniref:Response regulator n=1 Tax=Halomonas koreensis TaxID=245385 RepID=A0ABU1G5H3_9GAMM|nr:response regulator [Halomonas koreensis]MDR5868140.1 response regulator [Halomonas koreensis]
MSVETDKERAWSHLVKPILWPVLAVQVALVALCLAVGISGWWLMPSQASWSATFWLLLALLLGSSLNVAAFLMLLRQRLRGDEARVEAALARVGDRLRERGGDRVPEAERLAEAGLPLERRLAALEAVCEAVCERWEAELETARGMERRLADDLQAQQGRLARLESGREQAREASRLKSGYLSQLQRMLSPLMAAVTEVLDADPAGQNAGGQPRGAVERLRERLEETAVLLETLGEPEGGPATPGRVLVVDDGPVNLMLAQKVLERQGLRVMTASSGSEALACLDQGPVDLVFMDIYMADMDGVETCRAWRARESASPGHARSIMVALTANAGEADRRRFREAGMDDYLAKPYRPQDLLDRVRHWLPDTRLTGEGA